MAATTTLPVLFATGNHASRPAATAVGAGGLYSCTTHGLIYQTDGATWTTWATLGGAATITTKDEGSTLSSTVTTLDFVGAGVVASGSGATTTVTIAGGGGGGGPLAFLYASTIAR
jgi:hypothetical protein